jgi:hypothetical protein
MFQTLACVALYIQTPTNSNWNKERKLHGYRFCKQCYLSLVTICLSVYLCINQSVVAAVPSGVSLSPLRIIISICGSTALLLNFGSYFSFLSFYTVGRTPWTGDQPVARPLPAHTGQHKHRINAHRHQCLICESNPRSQCSSEWRQFML